jgi:hypothetical protein
MLTYPDLDQTNHLNIMVNSYTRQSQVTERLSQYILCIVNSVPAFWELDKHKNYATEIQ